MPLDELATFCIKKYQQFAIFVWSKIVVLLKTCNTESIIFDDMLLHDTT